MKTFKFLQIAIPVAMLTAVVIFAILFPEQFKF